MNPEDIAIEVENLSKLYRIGLREKTHESLGGLFVDFVRRPLQNYRKYRSLYVFNDVHTHNNSPDTIWAVKDVSFQVRRGEALAIIGRNGAGKSTLLKVLSRITPPTSGRITIRGRISSLLEVGTGFHKELTGRENVYLNGTVLGMKKHEVDRKFDEIVAFSGVEKFLDTPVKRYSSGMHVRLAFAVAAHLDPEILIVDEVLAVGDAAFQRRCIDKMKDVGKHGRTVLFVSHNMPAVTRLCPRAILLNDGGILADGPSHEVVSTYLNDGQATTAAREWADPAKAPGGDIARLRAVRVVTRDGRVTKAIDIRKEVGIQMEYDVAKSGYVLMPHYFFHNEQGINVFGTLDQDPSWRGRPRPAGRYISSAWIPGNFLAEGTLFVTCSVITLNPNILQFLEHQAVAFQVIDSIDGDSARADWTGTFAGVVRPLLKWTTEFDPVVKKDTSAAE